MTLVLYIIQLCYNSLNDFSAHVRDAQVAFFCNNCLHENVHCCSSDKMSEPTNEKRGLGRSSGVGAEVKCRGHRLGPSHRSHLLHLVGRISYQNQPAKGVWPSSITTRYTGGLGVWPATMPRPPHLQQSCPLLSRVVVGQDQPRPLLLCTLTQGQVKGQISSGV